MSEHGSYLVVIPLEVEQDPQMADLLAELLADGREQARVWAEQYGGRLLPDPPERWQETALTHEVIYRFKAVREQ